MSEVRAHYPTLISTKDLNPVTGRWESWEGGGGGLFSVALNRVGY